MRIAAHQKCYKYAPLLFPEHSSSYPVNYFNLSNSFPKVWPIFILYEALDVVHEVAELIWCNVDKNRNEIAEGLLASLAAKGLNPSKLYPIKTS